ncbi:conserved hypothetical protein [Aromatoleum aromaticum EbN1]|uniref:DUF748 domain-containing protein n=1 Tax=Aromatoleum aromaticum (strain DSM 19018 / LMG 30748 / EbN1) TaxID=76114 RepID=Q5NYY7_AROAE|nr:DUF748 domain-containing protein [Aromatoleum aromaticum]CAI09727.1 conserved hypothetical protein [Aromatoleum aromaticum EbN1]
MAKVRETGRLNNVAAKLGRPVKWIAGIVVVIAILGFLILPPVARHFGARLLGDSIGRTVTIEKVRINPFALSMTVSGFNIAEADGQGNALSFGTLYANLEAESLLRGGPVLRELRLERPQAHLVRLDGGRHNWSDVLERFAAKPQQEEKKGEARFSLNNIRVIDGKLLVEDRPVGLEHELSAINIGLPFLSNLPSKVELFVEPELSALVNGRPLQVTGQSRPFAPDRETALGIDLDGFDFTPYLAYLPFDAAFKVPEGRLTTRLRLAFSQPPEATPKVALTGSVELADLRLEGAKGEPMLNVPALALSLADVQPLVGKWHFGRLEISQPEVDVVRLAGGQINFQQIIPRPEAAAATGQPAQSGATTPSPGEAAADADVKSPPVFLLDEAKISGATVRFEDRAASAPFRTELKDLVLEAKNVGSAPDAIAEVALDFVTDAGEKSSHRDRLRLNPFELEGRVVAENFQVGRYAPYYAAALPGGEIRDGRLDVTVGYKVRLGEKEAAIDVLAESVVLRQFELALKSQKRPLVKLPQLALEAVAVSRAQRTVTIGAVESKGASFALVKARNGKLDALGLFDEPASPKGQAGRRSASANANPAAPEKPWSFALERLAFDDWAVRFEDRTQGAPIVLQAAGIKLKADGLSTAKGAATKFELGARVNKRGRAAVSGTIALDPLKGNLRVDLRSVDLLPLQPYVVEQLNIAISRGTVTTRGTLAFESVRGGNVKGRFRGNLGVANFSSIDKNHATDFLRWRSLALAEVDVRTAPLAVSIREVALTDFYTRLILDETGQLNLREIRQQPEAAPAADATKPAPESSGRTTSVEVPPPATPPPPISIGKILIKQGNIAFSDRFIRPNYDANLTGMEGEVVGLSSDPATLARLDLQGKVDDTAPVTISGEFNPFREDRYLDIAASVKDFELTGVSPYSSKYVGYGIQKGKLSADLTYKIEDRKLTATNRLFLDQLTFGDRADSPDAPNLPVQLAVSLLKNRAGEIDLNMPISGSLDDPQFSIGGLVVKAILNLIGKALTAPFALLGSMFGGGEELSQLDFPPGRSSFDTAAEQKIETLAKALTERPALQLEITGEADRESDTAGLKKVILLRMMKAAKLKESVRRRDEAPPLEDVVIDAEEYPKWLERVYRDADFKRPRNVIGLLKDLPEAEMEALMLANIVVDDEALRRLAQERAQSVKSRLLEKGEIAANRVFLLAPKVEPAQDAEGGGRSAIFSLR